jgi:uncharacterized protein YegP (UPF0339 family)
MEAAAAADGSSAPEEAAQQQEVQQSAHSPDRSYSMFDDSHDLWPMPPLASTSFPEVPPPSIEHASPASAVLAKHGVQHTDTNPVQTVPQHNGGVQQVTVNGWWSQRSLQQQQHTAAMNSEIAAAPRQAGRVRVSSTASKIAIAASTASGNNDTNASRHTNRQQQQQQQQQQHHAAVQSVTIQPGVAAQTASAANKSSDSDLQGATLMELCTRDKAKLAKLMQELSTSQSEVIAQGQRLDRLRAQNSEIISEMAETKSKFNQAIELLKKYQSRNSALQQECATATQAKEALQTKVDSVSSELQQLRGSSSEAMTHLQQRIAVLHKELRASESRCKTAQDSAKQLTEHKSKAENKLSLCATEKSTLLQQLADAKAKQLHTEELLAKSDKENSTARAELSELKARLTAFKAADTQREHQSMQSIQLLQQTVTALQLEVTAIRTKQQLEVTQTEPHEGSSDWWLRTSHNSTGNSSGMHSQQQQQQQHYDDNVLRSSVNSSIAQQRSSANASDRLHTLQRAGTTAANTNRSYEHQQQQQQQLNIVRSSYDYANSSLLDLVNELEYSDDVTTSNDTTLLHNTSSNTTDQYDNSVYSGSVRQRAPVSSTIQQQQRQQQQQLRYQRGNASDDFDTKSVRSSYSINSHTNTTALHDAHSSVNSNSNNAVSGNSRGHTFFESMLS